MLRVLPQSGTVLAIFALVLPPVAVLSSNAVVPLLLIAALLACLGAWLESRRLSWPPLTIIILFGILLSWAVVASFWSFNVLEALVLVLRLGILVLAGLALFGVVQGRAPDERRQIARWLLLGYCLGILVFFVEYLFDFPIHRFANQLDPSDNVPLSRLNRGATSLAMLVWPVAATLHLRLGRAAFVALPASLLPIVALSESMAALVGLAAGLAFAALCSIHRKAARWLLILGLAAGVLTAPLIAKGLYASGLHEWNAIPSTARHRVYIWNFVAERVFERPLFGWGLDASRNMPNMGVTPFRDNMNTVIPLHPHNAVMQIWMELGAVGAVLVLIILVLIARRLDDFPAAAQVSGLALFVTTLLIACSAYGMWQNKWVSTIFAVSVLVPLSSPNVLFRAPGVLRERLGMSLRSVRQFREDRPPSKAEKDQRRT